MLETCVYKRILADILVYAYYKSKGKRFQGVRLIIWIWNI